MSSQADLGPVGGGLGDTESLMNALNADSFLADVPGLPRLEMDDFLDSFLTSDKVRDTAPQQPLQQAATAVVHL